MTYVTPNSRHVSFYHSPTVYTPDASGLTDAEYTLEKDAARKRIRAKRLAQRQAAAQRIVDVDEALMLEYTRAVQTEQAHRDNVEAHA